MSEHLPHQLMPYLLQAEIEYRRSEATRRPTRAVRERRRWGRRSRQL
jgi:hypothetical protein